MPRSRGCLKVIVDYGTHWKAGQVMAVLEIPELQAQLQEDQAEIKNAMNQVTRAQHELRGIRRSTTRFTWNIRG